MANIEGMKDSHVVIKREDALTHLTELEQRVLVLIMQKVRAGREDAGKNAEPVRLVINTDEPYADEVIDILKANGHWG